MNLQQLRYAAEVARRGLNVSEAAAALHTSQPGVSKQLRALEEELGVEIFVRQGRRLTAVTDAGREILAGIERILDEIANLRVVGEEYADQARGTLAVAVTHTQARYALPQGGHRLQAALSRGAAEAPAGQARTSSRRLVIDGEADIAIATEALAGYEELVSVPALPVAPRRGRAGGARARGARSPSRWRRSRGTRSSPTTRASPGAAPSTAASRSAASSRRSRSRRSTPT